ncbi:MAG: RDD family protein [Litorilituus sp.]|nr:RDD family protein [Litorilituus sp.]
MSQELVDINNVISTDVSRLSEEETKHYLTPFAFTLDKSLFGLPLASPSKRAIALLIDVVLIAMLSDIPGGLLALAIAMTFYYLGNKKRAMAQGKIKGYKRRAMMRFIASIIVFLVIVDTIHPLVNYIDIEGSESIVYTDADDLVLDQSLAISDYIVSAGYTIADSACETLTCWQNELNLVATQLAKITFDKDIHVEGSQLNEIFADIVQEIQLTEREHKQNIELMYKRFHAELSRLKGTLPLVQSKSNELVLPDEGKLTSLETLKEKKLKKPIYSIIEWVKGIIEDLGLGFGWASFYFTVSTALGGGQTLGKKILGIKVLQLDGTPLSLWDSFGRYGGYGAGIATGLLGFMQIYWDPNRQAIHDKISATVVIDLRKSSLNK